MKSKVSSAARAARRETQRRAETRPRPHQGRSLLAEQRGAPLAKELQALVARLAPLTPTERLAILDALARVLDGIFVHLPLKRALYGFDPLRAIEHLRQQLDTLDDLQFHREVVLLVNRMRDAHTQYDGRSLPGTVARLPFLVETWGPAEAPRYVVSKVSDRRLVGDSHFVPGVTLLSWNGVPFDRAVDLHAESETGGRPDSRRARALDSLTFRALDYVPAPDEQWVIVGYRGPDGVAREVRFDWRVVAPGRVGVAGTGSRARARRGIDRAAEAVRRAKKLMFNPRLWEAEQRRPGGRRKAAGRYQDFLTARTVKTPHGTFGYLRIWSFDVDDDADFVGAVLELLGGLPDRGLILDLRDNPGGFIWAAERLLQLFTPNRVEPTTFALRCTPMTVALANAPANRAELGGWAVSLATAAATGEQYSQHLPLTSREQCNDIGQRYGGPVVCVVNANTYSSGDLFAAGILDNRIGALVCVGAATGAGGANVWEYEDVRACLPASVPALPALPDGVGFSVALRRAVRSGEADGTLIEDAGIPGQPYAMTQRDLFQSNADLIEHCAARLALHPWTKLEARRAGRTLTVETGGLDRLDIYFDGHPASASLRLDAKGVVRLLVPAGVQAIEVAGYAKGILRQRRLLLAPHARR